MFLLALLLTYTNNAQSPSFAGFNDRRVKKILPKIVSDGKIVKRSTTDVYENDLKGPVREILEEEQDLTGTWSKTGKHSSSLIAFDKNGNLTIKILYDYLGNPDTVIAYGFIDSFRVSKSAEIDTDKDSNVAPPLMTFPPPNAASQIDSQASKKDDPRYSVKYEYKYDDKGRLSEIVTFNNKGEKGRRTVFEYGEQKRTEKWIEINGDISSSTVEYFDKNGLLLKEVFEHLNGDYPDSIYNYTYQIFDKSGNWTKRTIDGREWSTPKISKRQNYIELRTIRYY